MTDRAEKVRRFRTLHEQGCFVIPNAWDPGSAVVLAGLGFPAIATTSSGYAFSRGHADYDMNLEDTLAYAGAIAAAVDVPVSADFEDCFAETPEGVGDVVRQAAEAGLAGLSIEDHRGGRYRTLEEAKDRVAAAVEAARRYNVVLTARADGLLDNAYGLDDAIIRAQAFAALGTEVVFVPGIPDLASLERLCASGPVPVNHLMGVGGAKGLTFGQIEAAGVRRISVGGLLARASAAALQREGRELLAGHLSGLEDLPGWDRLRGR